MNDSLNTSQPLRSVRSINWIGLTLLLLALLAALPIWTGPGLINTRGGGDSPFLFIRLQQLVANLQDGVFPARWMPDAAYGLGYPFFNYYASLPYYFGALFNLIGFDLLVSIKLVQTLGFVLATFAMYGWARRHASARPVSWLIAVAYLAAPFHFVNVYVRGDSLSEFYAFVFYPLILLAIDRVIESPRLFYWLAFAYGGLLLTHNVSALIFAPFALLYALIGLSRSGISHHKSKLLGLLLGFVLAFALSAWFWLPALSESNLVQLEVQTTGYFNYAGHFRSLDLIQASFGFDYSIAAAPGSSTPFAMGLAQVLAALLGLIGLAITWRPARDKVWRGFALIGLALSTFMITPWSQGLWDHLPLLPFTQFPWRFLSIQSLFTSVLIGYSVGLVAARRRVQLIGAAVLGLTLMAAVFMPLRPDYLPIRADEITAQRIQLYESFTTNIGTTIRGEYLPHAVTPHPLTGQTLLDPSLPPHVIVSSGQAAATQTARASIRQTWQVQVDSDRSVIDFPVLDWPDWQAAIDGQRVEVAAAPDLGYLQLAVPQGDHQVVLSLARTPIRALSETLSLVTLLTLAAYIGVRLIRDMPRLSVSLSADTRLILIVAAAALALVAVGLQAATAVAPNENDLTMDFVARPWLHHNPGGIDFGNSIKLLNYNLDETSDQAIHLSLNWAAGAAQAVSATIALVAPSLPAFDVPGPIDQQVQLIQSGSPDLQLTPPYQLATGLYYVRVRVGSIDQYLKPIWVQTPPGPANAHPFGKLTPAIGLAAVHMQQLDPHQLDVLLSWSISRPIDANYGISLRLLDSTGKLWQSTDTQPGYGFQPTSAWRPGSVNDAYTLPLPADLPLGGGYSLDVILYRIASKEEVGRATAENISLGSTYAWRSIAPPPRDFTERPVPNRVDAIFGGQIELLGYDLARAGQTLVFTPAWKAVTGIDLNYKVFVHVFDPATEKIVAQSDAMPRQNAYPTSRWLVGEVISESIALPLSSVPSGSYRIAIGLYDPLTNDRLPIGGDQYIDAANRRVILADVIEVK